MDKRLLEFLTINFDRYDNAEQLWRAAGGRPGMLLDTNNARVRWTDALQKIESGALKPQRFLLEALDLYPGNEVLLRALHASLSPEQRVFATRAQHAILAQGPDGAELVFQEVQALPVPEEQQAVLVSAAHQAEEASPEKSRGFWLQVKDTVATKGTELLIQAAVTAGVKALSGVV